MSGSALAGIRVVDCTHVIAGAYCSMLLADLGADVIKVEPLDGEGDRINSKRTFRPFDLTNRNKRAIAVDIQRPEGADIVRRLSGAADVFVENFRPGVCDRVGLGYADLRARNSGLIYCSISGFGHSGPYRERGGFDLVAQAMSGIMSFTGELGSTRPVAAGVPLSDIAAGCFGALGILAALNHRHATGEGQKVEASLLESALAFAVWETGLYFATGEVAKPRGSRHRLAAPYEALKTADGFVAVGVTSQRLWSRFCKALGADDLESDPKFASPAERIVNRDLLQQKLEALLAAGSTEHWVERLLAQGVPCGPVNTIAEAVNDPQIAARELFVDIDRHRFARAPIVLSETPAAIRSGAANVGQHTREELCACGYADREIDDLAARGIIRVGAD
ncbi:MAG: CoA transferase [Rhizomicrobium sp.]|jgi:crotonobetainyl-CoA:carnitine CoA-transferase CaiB-like acyl-CoA transferase